MFLAGLLLGILALLGSAFVILAMSERGTRILAEQAERWLPLRLEGVTGTLWRSIAIDRLTVELDGRELVISALEVALRLYPVLFDNRLELQEVRAAAVELVEVGAPAALAGPPARLALPFMPLDIELDALVVEQLRIPGVPAFTVRGAASWTARGLLIDGLTVVSEAFEAELSASLSAGLRPSLTATLAWALPEAGWAGTGDLSGPVDRLELTHAITGPYPLTLAGRLDLVVPAAPGFDLEARFEPVAIDDYGVEGLRVRLDGRLDALGLAAEAEFRTPYGEPFPVVVSATGSAVGPLSIDVSAQPLGGDVQASGTLAWTDGLVAAVTGSVRGLTLAPLLEAGDGRLDADFTAEYAEGRFAIQITELRGELDGRAVTGHARLAGAGADWEAESVEMVLGDNRAVFGGSWQGGELALDGRVAAAALEQLGIGIAGALDGEVDIAGAWPMLQGSVRITATGLAGAGAELADLRIAAAFDAGVVRGELASSRIAIGAAGFERVALSLRGPLQAVDWQLSWQGGLANGRLRQGADDLRLEVARLQAAVATHALRSSQPFAVRLRQSGVTVTPVCVVGAGARACLERFELEAGRLATTGALERLPLGLLTDYLPVAAEDPGYLEGRWALAGAAARWTGTLALAGRHLGVRLAEADERVEIPDLELAGNLVGDRLEVTVHAASNTFDLAGEVVLAPLSAAGELAGSAALVAADLSWLRVFDQRIAELHGSATGGITLAGPVRAPLFDGQIEVESGRLQLENPEVLLEGITLSARIDQTGVFEFSGRAAQPTGGAVTLAGAGAGVFTDAVEFRATLRGSGLRARDPLVDIEVAPDLELAFANGIARLTGVVEVPRADARINTLPTTVPRPSEDVSVIGRDAPVEVAANRFRTNVRVVLGRDVGLRGFGMQAGLKGALNVRRDARGQTRVRGDLDITGGVVSAQGQTLAIESGVVIYTGAIGNPFIDLRAVREVAGATSVKVGLHIRGNANRLTSTVFSEPLMAENRALAFLVLGRDINAQSEADSSQLIAAAINLGLSRSRSLTAGLQRLIGLDEISAVAEGQDSFSIAAGKRLTDDIMVRYTYNTLTAAGAILISLDLTRRWRLEVESGEVSAVDLLYRLER
jgi:translocation and assembly module TamB